MNYKRFATNIRKRILRMTYQAKVSHIGSCFSCVDILIVLYFKILRINPKRPKAKNRDIFILSKGHAAAAQYAVLAEKDFFSKKLLSSFCVNAGKLPGHATAVVPGVEVSTGSLGHGLAIGAGMALAARHDKKTSRIFVLLSDGECQEGSVWETALFAGHHQLDNLIAIIDDNNQQGFGKTSRIMNLKPLIAKWQSFGWAVKQVDGHEFEAVETALSHLPFEKAKPNAIIARTIKGKGVSFMEDSLLWHYRSPDDKQYKAAIKELDKDARSLR